MAGRVAVKPMVVMTGGVALNSSLVDALSDELNTAILVPDHPQAMGALGAALFAWEKFHKS
jgi:activator of 2-hydroxyglutaryl-CoA dehydratase